MKKDYFYFGAVLDRSGSMSSQGKIIEAQTGFNSLIEEKKGMPYKADVMVTIFDDLVETLYEGDIQQCPSLTNKNFFPRGMTRLYDAIGTTIDKIGIKLAQLVEEERPEKVIICIITDGEENASCEYSSARIKEMITRQKEVYAWEFMFIGANEKSVTDAVANLNIVKAFKVDDNSRGMKSAYMNYSASIDNLTGYAGSAIKKD